MTTPESALLSLLRFVLTGVNGRQAADSAPAAQTGAKSVKKAAPPAMAELSAEERLAVFRLAENHKLLPLILDSVCAHPMWSGAADSPAGGGKSWRELALDQALRQAIQENEFLELILALRERGIDPIVVKGPVCRALYPKPLLRPSVDDDLLIPEDSAPACHEAMLELGLSADHPEQKPEDVWELSYHKLNTPLYVELHKSLFSPEDAIFRGYNELFNRARSRTVPIRLQDVTLMTLSPEDHLLFLILHAFKHFLHSGFGLRIVADICLFSRAYGGEIDFSRLLSVCGALRCDRFAAAVYRIGEKYLGLPAPSAFAERSVDETALLADVLAAGLHGAEIDRLHSANITLNAVQSQIEGRKASGSLRNTVFLPVKKLSDRYSYLEKCPWLLPAAWVSRAFGYLTDRRHGKQDPKTSFRIGKERVRLLQEYGVIDA